MKNRKKITTMSIRKVYEKIGELYGACLKTQEFWNKRADDWREMFGEDQPHERWLRETASEYGYIATKASLLAFSLYTDIEDNDVYAVHSRRRIEGFEKGCETQRSLFD